MVKSEYRKNTPGKEPSEKDFDIIIMRFEGKNGNFQFSGEL